MASAEHEEPGEEEDVGFRILSQEELLETADSVQESFFRPPPHHHPAASSADEFAAVASAEDDESLTVNNNISGDSGLVDEPLVERCEPQSASTPEPSSSEKQPEDEEQEGQNQLETAPTTEEESRDSHSSSVITVMTVNTPVQANEQEPSESFLVEESPLFAGADESFEAVEDPSEDNNPELELELEQRNVLDSQVESAEKDDLPAGGFTLALPESLEMMSGEVTNHPAEESSLTDHESSSQNQDEIPMDASGAGDEKEESFVQESRGSSSSQDAYSAISAIELMDKEFLESSHTQNTGNVQDTRAHSSRSSGDSPGLQIVEETEQNHPGFILAPSQNSQKIIGGNTETSSRFRTLLPRPPPYTTAPEAATNAGRVIQARTIVPRTAASSPQQIFEEQMQAAYIRRRKRQMYQSGIGERKDPEGSQSVSVVSSADQGRPKMSATVTHVPIARKDSGDQPDVEILETSVLSSAQPSRTTTVSKWEDPLMKTLQNRPRSPPPYRFQAPPPELGLNIPEGGYPCVDCGDIFGLKTSLSYHLERKVTKIFVYCNVCRSSYTFNNRCKFLEHQRNHLEDVRKMSSRTKIIYRDVQVKSLNDAETEQALDQWHNSPSALTLGNLGVLYETEFGPMSPALRKLLASSESQSNSSTQPTTQMPQLRRLWDAVPQQLEIPEGPNQPRLFSTKSGATPPGAAKCTECDHLQQDLMTLKRHFVFNLPPNQKQFICQSCSAVYFSLCSFSAHKRTHQKTPERQAPFTCPECGVAQSCGRVLMSHMLNHKSAPTIINAWRCAKCFTFYSNWNTLVVHIATNHSEYYFKCPKCPTAFQGFTNYDDHRRVHTGPGEEPLQAEMVPKCPNCESILKNREQMVEHLKGHMENMIPLKVYRCPICGRLMENKTGLVAHYSRTHLIAMRHEDVADEPFKLEDKPSASSFPPVTTASHFVRIAPKQQQQQKTGEQQQQQEKPPQMGVGTLERSPNPTSFDPGTAIRCPKCPPDNQTLLLNQFMLQLHMKVKHGETAEHRQNIPSSSGYTQQPSYGQRVSAAQSSIPTVLKGGYACKKFGCFFVAGTREDMRRHAANNHRDNTHYLCLECGLSFVSEEALKRHLLAHHQISDPTLYVRESRECYPMLGPPTLFKCSVCGATFGSEMELDVHSRIHGMLFLQQKTHNKTF